jgi:hypothetical protein
MPNDRTTDGDCKMSDPTSKTTIAKLKMALAFYADERRYEGPNQKPIENDPYQPDHEFPYLLDIIRDGGSIAREALKDVE